MGTDYPPYRYGFLRGPVLLFNNEQLSDHFAYHHTSGVHPSWRIWTLYID